MEKKKILEVIVCPKCKDSLKNDEESKKVICNTCKKAYPVIDGVPILIIEEAVDI